MHFFKVENKKKKKKRRRRGTSFSMAMKEEKEEGEGWKKEGQKEEEREKEEREKEEREEEEEEKREGPESFLIVYNIAKRHNLGTLARSATAFGVSELILVGKKDYNAFGSHGSTAYLRFRHFFTLPEAQAYLKEKSCDICGVEIMDNARAVHEYPFTKSTAFLVGNEGTGLSSKEIAVCDFFVFIPQYGCGTASLNVTVAASIVLQHFAVWARFPQRQRDGQKFVVAERPSRYIPTIQTDTPEIIAEKRRQKSASSGQDWLDIEEVGLNFSECFNHNIAEVSSE